MKLMGLIFSLLTPGLLACGWIVHRRRALVAPSGCPRTTSFAAANRTRPAGAMRTNRVLQFTRLVDLASAVRLHREETRQQPWEGRN